MAAGYVSPVSMHMKQLQMHCPSLALKTSVMVAKTGTGYAYGAAGGSGGEGEHGFKGSASEAYYMKRKPGVSMDDSQCTTGIGDKGFNSRYSGVDEGEEAVGLLDTISTGPPLDELVASKAGSRLPQSVLMLLRGTVGMWREDELVQRGPVESLMFNEQEEKPSSGARAKVAREAAQSSKQPLQSPEPAEEASPTRSLKGVRVRNLPFSETKQAASSPGSMCHAGFGASSSNQAYTMPASTKISEAKGAPDQTGHMEAMSTFDRERQMPPVMHGCQVQMPDFAQQVTNTHASFRAPPGLLHPSADGEVGHAIDVDAYASEADEPDSDLEDEPTTVMVGPSPLASAPYSLQQVAIPDHVRRQRVFVKSGVGQLALSDAYRLMAGGSRVPLSFGSAVHLAHGERPSCRPCMYERWAGRCSKKWLCDFCHLHVGSKRKTKNAMGARDRHYLSNSFSPPVSNAGPDGWMAGHPLLQRL